MVAKLPDCWLSGCGRVESRAGQEQQAGATVDSEHIFGFTEGPISATKAKRAGKHHHRTFGKQGDFAILTNETSYPLRRRAIFPASVGILTDYYSVHDTPGYLNRTGLRQSGVTSEFRWQFSSTTAPIGNPVACPDLAERQRSDAGTGAVLYAAG